MKIMLLGASGQLGQAFRYHPTFNHTPGLTIRYLSRAELDICNYAAVAAYFLSFKPDVVINCAAYTAVDAAEQHKQLCLAINTDAVANLAQQCHLHNALLVQFSTDYVFDGNKATPYTELDTPNPINHYGWSKWQAELYIQQYCKKHLILRTSWLFSEYGHNFHRTMLNLADKGQPITVINDQIGCPTYAGDVVSAVLSVVKQYQVADNITSGVYHLAGQPAVSWFEFAQHIFFTHKITCHLTPITSNEWQASAKRPLNSTLDCQHIHQTFNILQPLWKQALLKIQSHDVHTFAGIL